MGTSNNTSDVQFKLPDDFAQRLDEISLLKSALEELMRDFKNVIFSFILTLQLKKKHF